MHRNLAGNRHRHMHVRAEYIAPLRTLVSPGGAPGEYGVHLIFRDPGVGQCLVGRRDGKLDWILAILHRRVCIAHAYDRGGRLRCHGHGLQAATSGNDAPTNASRSSRRRNISKLHSPFCTTVPSWLTAFMKNVITPYFSSFSFFLMTSQTA
ncbi:Uncharacterised protein [Bordetella pertussis]|nr:Uncharacterised protein [Bordetella pertussis]